MFLVPGAFPSSGRLLCTFGGFCGKITRKNTIDGVCLSDTLVFVTRGVVLLVEIKELVRVSVGVSVQPRVAK